MISAEDIQLKGPNRTVSPRSGTLFGCAQVAELFKNGTLAIVHRKVIDRGLLAELHEDIWFSSVCPACHVRWPEVLFMAVDYACRCGYVFAGYVDEVAADTVLAAQLWSAAVSLFEQRHEAVHPEIRLVDDDGDDTEANAAVLKLAYALEEQIVATRKLPHFLISYMRRTLGWKVYKKRSAISKRFTFAVWCPQRDLIQ